MRTSVRRLAGDLAADWKVNRGDLRSRIVVCSYRLAHHLRRPLSKSPRWWVLPIGAVYKGVVAGLLTVDIPWTTVIGKGLRIQHGYGIVVHRAAQIGDHCTLKQGVTIGVRLGSSPPDAPILGDGVSVGSGAQLLGSIRIGDKAKIGAGAIVLRDVPAECTAVGNPARVIGDQSGS